MSFKAFVMVSRSGVLFSFLTTILLGHAGCKRRAITARSIICGFATVANTMSMLAKWARFHNGISASW